MRNSEMFLKTYSTAFFIKNKVDLFIHKYYPREKLKLVLTLLTLHPIEIGLGTKQIKFLLFRFRTESQMDIARTRVKCHFSFAIVVIQCLQQKQANLGIAAESPATVVNACDQC